MKLNKPLKCSEAGDRKVLEALISHKLEPDDEDRLLKHLRTCPKCLSNMAVIISQMNFIDPHDSLLEM